MAENNVIVNTSLHPHVWYANSQDVFRRNIVFWQYKPVGMNKPWGKECDFNLLHKPGLSTPASALVLQQASGSDANSLEADALFVDPAKGDYRVKDDSPALKLGFRNFPMDQFGVQKPALRAMAKTPQLPSVRANATERTSDRDASVVSWLGAKLKNVIGLGEVSAAGLPGEIGVRVEEVEANTAAERFGFKPNDVILKYGNTVVNAMPDFLKADRAAAEGKLKLEVFRGQQRETLDIEKSGSGPSGSVGTRRPDDAGHPHDGKGTKSGGNN